MEKSDQIDKFYYVYPQTVAFVAVANNVMPAAWHTPISAQPPLYGILISPKRYTFELLEKEEGFTVNFLEHKYASISAHTGSISGRHIDKFGKLGIDYFRAEKVNGLILKSSYAAFECKKYAVAEYGDHHLFIGQIVIIHYRADIFTSDRLVDEKNILPILYFGKDRYITTDPNTLTIHKRE